jgi:hypothetical protein
MKKIEIYLLRVTVDMIGAKQKFVNLITLQKYLVSALLHLLGTDLVLVEVFIKLLHFLVELTHSLA